MNTWTRLMAVVVAVLHIGFNMATAHADSYSWIDPGDNEQIMQEVANALADVEAHFGTGPLEARTGWLGGRSTFAAAMGNAITVNKAWTLGSYEDMAAAINVDIVSGFHNGGCSPIRGVALHEAAHVINNQRRKIPEMRAQRAVGIFPRPDLRGALSGYSFDKFGAVDASEALAEAFQAKLCGTAGPEEQELYEMLVN